ncbi:BCL2/adenovirus E1B 19 kDa protein-interacting protein 2-like isoform X3 [Acanthopagrus latus]|uniref:BCL2/adenovirus E1B 19 kDa protein-interacting protein 2-like isoform X3 n=1 Tax=Acanthopagrus latus TaxID=8177 RepID=UPI00187CE86E|nr:BCL2/adenovirus E1B 19 kDa protein-interacting protein 2-like isoform X3 [Acanthopagrus latus]
MESREEEPHDDPLSSQLTGEDNTGDPTGAAHTSPAAADSRTLTIDTPPEETCEDQTSPEEEEEEEETGELIRGNSVTTEAPGEDAAGVKSVSAAGDQEGDQGESTFISPSGLPGVGPDSAPQPGAVEDEFVSEQNSSAPTQDRPAPPTSLLLSKPKKKKVLVAPSLSLSLGHSESTVSDDFPSVFLSPSFDDDDDTGLDFDLDAMETPSDSESLRFPIYDLDLEDDLRRLGVATRRCAGLSSSTSSRFDPQTGSGPAIDQSELGALEREDMVDSQGTRWRCFSTGVPPQESRVNMSVLEPYLRVLSHGGYYGEGMNDIIVFSSCYLPQNSLDSYQYVMDNLFRYVVGTLELMVAENYVVVYLCAGGQKDKLPGISWLKECYTTIDRRLRKNLKGFYVVHPTWYIKALATIIKPFISSKFSRKLQFVDSLQDLSHFVPTEHVQIPDCVSQYDQSLSR